MEALNSKIKEIRNCALNNWLTKDVVNSNMTNKEFITAASAKIIDTGCELALGSKIMDVVLDDDFTKVADNISE